MSRIPAFKANPPTTLGPAKEKLMNSKQIASNNASTTLKRPSDGELNMIGKRQKTEICSGGRIKVLNSAQTLRTQKNVPQKSARAILQPIPDTGFVRNNSSMPAVVSSTVSKFKVPGKPKRPAWDLKGRIQDMENHFVSFQDRIASLESANEQLAEDNEVKSAHLEEGSSQIQILERDLKQKTEALKQKEEELKEKEKEIREVKNLNDDLNREINTLRNQYNSLQNMYQEETSALKCNVSSLTCIKSAMQAELDEAKLLIEKQIKEIQEKKSHNHDLLERISTLESNLREQESLRRRLHNTVQELKGNIRVFCRLRPPILEEVKNGMKLANIVAISDKSVEILDTPSNECKVQKHEFSFDCYFPGESSQAHVFNEISQLVQSALDGYNVCIFAYGQTGSGKTFTMEGPKDIVDFVANRDNQNLGMIPRTVQQIFSAIAELELKGWKYRVEALFLEIYNERIKDLLSSEGTSTKCEIIKSGTKGIDCVISNVNISEVSSSEQVFKLMKKAKINRAVAATKCNEYSSRSHYVFQLKLYGENTITGEKSQGALNLVDLAGSERIKDSESAGERLTEAKSINKSLSNLGKVILSLSNKESHVPYRDSKLTHLLANSLGGSSKCLMFVNISPDSKNLSETINSLRFATKVNQCNIGTAQRKIR